MSHTEVGKLLLGVGAELGRTPEQMAPIVKRLVEEEWYDTIDSLRAISDDQWTKLSLPTRLVEKLRERLVNASEPPALLPIQTAVDTAPESIQDAPSIPVSLVVDALKDDIPTDVVVDSVRTLERIVRNVLSEPNNPKYRQLKADNPKICEQVTRWHSGVQMLNFLGFNLVNNMFKCEVIYIGRFHDAHRELLGLLSTLDPSFDRTTVQNTSSSFNPFQATMTNAGDTFGIPQGSAMEQRDAEIAKLRKEAEDSKNQIPAARGLALEPPKLVSVGGTGSSVSSFETYSQEDDASLLLASLRSIAAAGESAQQFRSREKQELERIKNRQVFHLTKVRVMFLDRKALEINVSAGETVDGLYKIVSECMKAQLRTMASWSLMISPPPRILDRSSRKSMTDEGFVPSVSLRFTINGKQCNSFDVLVPDLIV